MDEMKKTLLYEPKNGYDRLDAAERLALEDYCRGYMAYLDAARTEREAVSEAVKLAESAGFVSVEALDGPIAPGQKVYWNNRGKALLLAVGGTEPMNAGFVVEAAHVDAPRLDLKQLPLFEDSELGYLRTHYYGGIKKYQWTAIPLELHGVVALADGSTVEVSIGHEPDDPSSSSRTCCPIWPRIRCRRPWPRAWRARSSASWWAAYPMPGRGPTG